MLLTLATASLSGLTSQPNLNSIVNALRSKSSRDTGLDLNFLNELSIYWESRQIPADPSIFTSPKFGSAEVYTHEMPGGQYTNLREQARALGLGSLAGQSSRYYEVNLLLGDIVKVTSSKSSATSPCSFSPKAWNRRLSQSGTRCVPESVVDMLSGGLGQPVGDWPKAVQKTVLGDHQTLSRTPRRAPKRSTSKLPARNSRKSSAASTKTMTSTPT